MTRSASNSLDAVSDRDFAIEFTAAASLVMVHVSRFSEELVLWMSQNFGFIDIADRFCTGSSIMPQKKNPDVPELARGKTGRVVGHLMALLTLMKGQPLAYNKDNQEDKEPLFDTVDTRQGHAAHLRRAWSAASPSSPRPWSGPPLRGYATATDLADYLVKKGLPFRDAHEAVAHAVKPAMPGRGRPGRAAAGDAAGLPPRHRERRVRRADAARLARLAQGRRRHRAGAGARQIARHRARLGK